MPVTHTLRVLSVFYVCLCVMSYGCAGSDSDPDATFVTTLHTLDTEGEEKSEFLQGEDIQFELNTINTSDSSQTLTFASGQQYDFFVRRKGASNVIWQWSHDKVFIQAVTSLTFDPAETKTFTEVWNQRDNNGVLIDSGQYEVQGVVVGQGDQDGMSSASEFRSSFVEFRIL